jgi:hypothetical protein
LHGFPVITAVFHHSRQDAGGRALHPFVNSKHPDMLTLTGAAIIIGTGLYMFLRERRVAEVA